MTREEHLGQVVRNWVVHQLLVAEVDDDPDAARRRRIGDGRDGPPSSMSAPVGLLGEFRMMAFVFGVMAAITRRREPRSRPRPVVDDDGRRAHQLHLLGDGRPAGSVGDDLVAWIEERKRRVEECLLAAHRDQHLGGGDVDAVVLPIARRRFAQLGDARGNGIAGEVGIDCRLARGLHVRGRRESRARPR